MKVLATIIVCICLSLSGSAQGFFNQNGAMVKRAIQQIALLGTYIRQAKQGYSIIDKGLKSIHHIKNGEFNLHDLYYTSLKTVNPNIKDFSKVDAAMAAALTVSQSSTRAIRLVNSSRWLSPGEKEYLRAVFTKLMDETDRELQTLTDLVTSGKMQLTDDERLRRIDTCYQSLTDKSAFCQQFSAGIKELVSGRSNEADGTAGMDRFYNLKN
ncbi:hypothetical protein LL912_12550 [Niabella sp. CC-SYL272]|uniref:hypothetical protein n=1 Tax=Niabella agricola TaxID=2891571 RepID=UPI001F2E3A17|nr:hypothetical protein [Niabella agricola]MCF3109603.1 hypothetical protein [Niabella agricola]